MAANTPGRPRVAIIYGSPAERDTLAQAGAMLERFGIAYDETSISAHRAPRALTDWISELEPRGVDVVIAGAGIGAALPGIIAASVAIPVIGVPLKGGGTHDGFDAMLAMTQMPSGVPVATVGMGHATNAAVLAVQILAVSDPALRARIWEFKDQFEQAAALTS